jgi:predicted O-methyltransferase YrrM
LAQYTTNLVASAPPAELMALLAPFDEWTVSLETANLLDGLVRHLSPSSILEFGAGRSSLVLASALHGCGGGRLTSIEHQPAYAEQAWGEISQFGAVDAKLVHARLTVQISKHGLLHEYVGIDGTLRTRGSFDFVFIDAPPGHLGRDATLLAVAPFLAAGAVVVLDDAKRPGEKTAVRRWNRAMQVETVFQSDEVGKGVVVLSVQHPAAPGFSFRTFVGTIHDRIVEWQRRRAGGKAADRMNKD